MEKYYWDNLTAGKKWLWILFIIVTFPIGLIVYFLAADTGVAEIDTSQSFVSIQTLASPILTIPSCAGYDSRGICFCPNCGNKASLENPVTWVADDLACGKCRQYGG